MGALTSRQSAGVEEVDIGVNHAYRYPPKSGNYFSSHFIMGGERFETAQPEMYLFGENMDVNFLGSRPAPFPYPAPTANEPSKTLKALINIRKESLRFVRAPDDSATLKGPDEGTHTSKFNIEFTFDCDVRCAITIMYFCTEEVTTSGMIYTPRDPLMNSETYHYKRGANQQFSQVCHVFDPSLYSEEDLMYSFDREMLPIVIYCLAEEGEEPRQSHATFAIVEKHTDGYALKPLKQKLFVDGLSYLLQEIYGIENKNADKVSSEDDTEDNGAECVICMCDLRDTLILPCRHLCLCNCCADSLRYQASNCPICRAPFRALLQFKALQKLSGTAANAQSNAEVDAPPPFVLINLMPETEPLDSLFYNSAWGGENIPAGYEAVPLIEALNGPSVAPQQPSALPTNDLYVQLSQNATDAPADGLPRSDPTRCFMEGMGVRAGAGTLEDSTTQTERPPSACDSTTQSVGMAEMRMSVLLAQESEDMPKTEDPPTTSPLPSTKKKSSQKHHSREKQKLGSKDSVKVVNELSGPRSLEMDPAEIRSLLDEERLETNFGGEQERRGRAPIEEMQPNLRAPQAEEEEEEEEEGGEEEREEQEEGASVREVDGRTVEVEPSGAEKDLHCPHSPSTPSPSPTTRKRTRGSRGQQSAPSSPSGATAALNLTQQSESLSLPGTPLSNASAISRSSDASVSSASSTRALLSHPTHTSSASIV